MAWFLSNKKKQSTRGKRSAAPPPSQRRKQLLMGLVVIIALAGLAWGWIAAERYLKNYITQTRGQAVQPDQVVLVDQPAWMSETVSAELRSLVSQQMSGQPFDPASLSRVAQVLTQVPWVQTVKQVSRRPNGQIAVEAVYRQPVAVVEGRDGYHLVDAQAIRLPGLYQREQVASLPVPLVVGVKSAPPPQPGMVWRGSDVQAGLALSQLLNDQPFADQILAFDVTGRDAQGRVRLALITEAGRVEWGYPPGKEMTMEPTPQVKTQRLMWIANQPASRGKIDGGGKHLDISGAEIGEY